jgi:hypothetical protein
LPTDRATAKIAAAVAVLILTLGLVYLLRPLGIIRGPFMLLVRHPMLVTLPLICFLITFGLGSALVALRGGFRRAPEGKGSGGAARRRGRSKFDSYLRAHGLVSSDQPLRLPLVVALAIGSLGLLCAAGVTKTYTGRAIYANADFQKLLPSELSGGEVRVKPYEVALKQLQNSLNTPTEKITNMHIVKVGDELRWTAFKDPEGLFRVYTKKTAGIMSVTGESSSPSVEQSGTGHDEAFEVGPGMKWSDGIKWRIAKDFCYTCDVAEMTAIPTANGPVVIAPYIAYEGGLLVKRPVFGGVYLVDAGGSIEDLSPAEALENPLVAASGRLYPEKLARRTADSYKYKNGILNRMFIHDEQLEVSDTEENSQPYLQDFKDLGLQWVTTMKPRGETFTTAAVLLTDAQSGENRAWVVSKGTSLIGNEKAPDIVRGESIPGITFADAGADDAGGKFRVVEPRQIFPGGRLQFLLTIIPNSSNRSTMSIIVDAERQEVVAKFPATTEGDADLIEYLASGTLPEDETVDPGEVDGELTTGEGAAATLERLLEQNRTEQAQAGDRIEALKTQERDLERLLKEAEREVPEAPAEE